MFDNSFGVWLVSFLQRFYVNFKNFIGSLRLSQATGRGCEDMCMWKDYSSSGAKLGIY